MARRKNRMPAALARYWASHRRGGRRRNPSRRRSVAHHYYASAAPRRHRRRNQNPHRRRSRNTSLRGLASRFTSSSALKALGAGAAAFFGARFIPQNIGFLSQYNAGVSGYFLNAGIGLGISYFAGKFLGKEALVGGLVGTGLAVISRMVTDAGPGTATGTAMQGDLDFDLGYYIDDGWPLDRTTGFGPAGGPYATFPGNPRSVAMLPTGASAVRAGATAAAAVPGLPGPYGGGAGYSAAGGWRGAGRWPSR